MFFDSAHFEIVFRIVLFLYTCVVVLCLLETYFEGERMGGAWDANRILGLVICLVWPVLLVAFVIRHALDRRQDAT